MLPDLLLMPLMPNVAHVVLEPTRIVPTVLLARFLGPPQADLAIASFASTMAWYVTTEPRSPSHIRISTARAWTSLKDSQAHGSVVESRIMPLCSALTLPIVSGGILQAFLICLKLTVANQTKGCGSCPYGSAQTRWRHSFREGCLIPPGPSPGVNHPLQFVLYSLIDSVSNSKPQSTHHPDGRAAARSTTIA
eukprot:3544165-Pleurochrysis_carterae.AAC.2